MNNELLSQAFIPQEQWQYCYITEDGRIFTPIFDKENNMTLTGEEHYQKNLIPVIPTPTLAELNRADIDYILLMQGL